VYTSQETAGRLRFSNPRVLFGPVQFLALTDEDLNNYDLTQGAKKKLKTQLELQKTQLEIQKSVSATCGTLSPLSVSFSRGL